MVTFFICLALLIAAYFTYGRYLEKVSGIENSTEVPSKTMHDGVDFIPMPRWKTFMIQLLNISGLGPIFGAVLGATYGPIAFLWITLGGIFMGAMHDFLSGVMSLNNGGASLPEIIGKYLGLSVRQVMGVFAATMMLLVGAVFMLAPAGLLNGMIGGGIPAIGLSGLRMWVLIVFAYYVVATLLPIDKIIGTIYPVFGFALIFMALGIFYLICTGDYNIPELTSIENMKFNPGATPIIPTLFITIACGAISGFHATQSTLMARCLKNKKESRSVFYGAMISESIIALIWAAIAMAFFAPDGVGKEGVTALNQALADNRGDASWVVNHIAKTGLGKLGAALALLGVVAAPITSGDTAFRSARLIIADLLKINQKSLLKRLYICVPMFTLGYIITLLNYEVLWRYFGWANQTLSVFTLWAITVWLYSKSRTKLSGETFLSGRYHYLISMIPALFMTFICSDFLLTNSQMFGLDQNLGASLAGVLTLIIAVSVCLKMRAFVSKPIK